MTDDEPLFLMILKGYTPESLDATTLPGLRVTTADMEPIGEVVGAMWHEDGLRVQFRVDPQYVPMMQATRAGSFGIVAPGDGA